MLYIACADKTDTKVKTFFMDYSEFDMDSLHYSLELLDRDDEFCIKNVPMSKVGEVCVDMFMNYYVIPIVSRNDKMYNVRVPCPNCNLSKTGSPSKGLEYTYTPLGTKAVKARPDLATKQANRHLVEGINGTWFQPVDLDTKKNQYLIVE